MSQMMSLPPWNIFIEGYGSGHVAGMGYRLEDAIPMDNFREAARLS